MEATFWKELLPAGRDGYVTLFRDLRTLEARPLVSFQDDGANDARHQSIWEWNSVLENCLLRAALHKHGTVGWQSKWVT